MLPEIEKIQKTQVNQNMKFQQIQQKLSNSLVGKFTNTVSLKMSTFVNLKVLLSIFEYFMNKISVFNLFTFLAYN